MPHITNTTLGGHLHLECSTRADGTPYISQQDFCVPIHIGKGHVDQGAMVLNLVNPTAGFFDGDRVDLDITVREGARLCLSTPAASRVYSSRSGKAAANHQRFAVRENGVLEWNPEPFIPHAGASYHQSTAIHLHPSASLLFFEWISPGRVAMGEMFAYQKLRWEMDVYSGELLAARERYDLDPSNHSLESLRLHYPAAHYLSIFVAGKFVTQWPSEELNALHGGDVHLGHGALEGGVYVIRALCSHSIVTRRLFGAIRNILYANSGMKPPSLGRTP